MSENEKEENSKEYLEKMWHTTAHVFAEALTETYPTAMIAIGPPIEEGFHYDFDLEKNLDNEDLKKIEKKMKEIIKRKEKMVCEEVDIDKATEIFSGNKYKTELIKELKEKGETKVTVYRTGENGKFFDLCKGPHLESTEPIKAFRLLKTSRAYWKGDEKNKQLQRVYGISFPTKEELKEWIENRKKAEENSNIKLGKDLDLYMISESVGKGLPIWCPNGAMLRMQLQNFLMKEQMKQGYKQLVTPHIGRLELFKQTGHYQNYGDMMYAPIEIEDEKYLLKPMNCPFHIQYYMKEPRSYRDLPLKLGEMGTVYRYEKSGELSGLLRVRGFTQDDAHIFCMPGQVKEQFGEVFDLVLKVMKILKLEDFRVRVGTKDPESDKYVGSDENWKKSTQEIIDVLEEKNINYTIEEGDAAFYGPKADIVIRDSLKREWQTGTVQLDYNIPERLELEYIGQDGGKHRPVMIHRAPFGSFERFTAVIIEHFGGVFPLWLAPEQVRVVPVSENFLEYGKKINDLLIESELRSELDKRNETLGYRIRDAQKKKIPYVLIVGAKEQENNTVSVRDRDGKQETMAPEEFLEKAKKEITEKK